jgi:hypothetical protein
MYRRLWFGFVPLLCSLACLLNAAPADAPTAAACAEGEQKEEKALAGNWVCPVFVTMNFGSYCTYYAINCPTKQPCPLNSACGLPSGDCANPTDPPCTNVGSFAGKEEKGKQPGHHTHPSLHGGVSRAAVKVNPIPKESRSFCRLVGAPMLASLPVGKRTVKAVLYLVLVNPPDGGKVGAPRIFGSGVQAHTREEPELTIPAADVTVKDKVCTVSLGSVTYVVLLEKDAPAPKKED